MRRQVLEMDRRGPVEIRGLVDSDDIDALSAEERRENGGGFTLGRAFRKVANIDEDFFNALCLNMDKDALDFAASGYRDRGALRCLLARFPNLRCSEGRL